MWGGKFEAQTKNETVFKMYEPQSPFMLHTVCWFGTFEILKGKVYIFIFHLH